MIKKAYIFTLLMLCGIWGNLSAQRYDLAAYRNFWNAGSNVNGLRTDSLSISYAEVYGARQHGLFKDSYEADRLWHAGALAESMMHFDTYSVTGRFSFDHAQGRNMSGSMFIHPGLYPVDVLEFTPGRKTLQTYSFMGGITVDIAPNWRVGGKVDFTSANYAKRKDLRHTNYRLDLNLIPSVMYYRDDFVVGLSVLAGKNTESVDAEEVGSSVSTYYAFLDKGLMYGAYEAWTGNGVHLNESGVSGFPVEETVVGVGLQAAYKGLYADVNYRYQKGEVGERRTIWFRFPTQRISAQLAYRFLTEHSTQAIRLSIDYSHQKNNENVLGSETINGITSTVIYGSNRIFERDILSAKAEYELNCIRGNYRIGGTLTSIKRLSSQMFPYSYSQSLISGEAYVTGIIPVWKFDIEAGAAFTAGSFTDKEKTTQTDVTPGEPPYYLEKYHLLQSEYLTATRMKLNAGLRYSICKGIYAGADVSFVRAFGLDYIEGSNRWTETLKIGYIF